MPTTASSQDVARIRLRSQLLGPADPNDGQLTPTRVVERLLAIQAQDLPAAAWALGARAPGSRRCDVDDSIDSAQIVRSWPMRGTLHFVPAADLGWMLDLTAARLVSGTTTRRTQLGLDLVQIERARELAIAALSGGGQLSRAEFLALLEAHGIPTANQRGYHLIWHLAQTGTLCWGPLRGTTQTLVLLDDWVTSPRRLARDEALGEFVVRYFAGHGPATRKDFAWWSQLTLADAKRGLAVARERLIELDVNGTTHYLPADADTGDWGSKAVQRSPILALGGFDEILLGYTDRSFAVSSDDFPRVVPGKNGIFLPLILSAGRVIGTWRRQKVKTGETVEVIPFGRWNTRQQAGLRRSLARYEDFVGVPVQIITAEAPSDPPALA